MKKNLLFASIIALLSMWSINTFAADRATIAKYYSSLQGLKKRRIKEGFRLSSSQPQGLRLWKRKGTHMGCLLFYRPNGQRRGTKQI